MTQWVEKPSGGRERGPAALLRAWLLALVRPRTLFRSGVAPADQAPGLVFAVTVVVVEEGSRFLLVEDAFPVYRGLPVASALFALAVAGLLVAPALLHLMAALQTVVLIPFAPDRAGVSETVQVIAYAIAPCVFAGLPYPAVRAIATTYGAVLLVVGLSEVHGESLLKSAVLGAVPAALIFGYAFRGFGAIETVLANAGVV